VPRVAESPVSFECKLTQILQLQGVDGVKVPTWLILGEVVAVHIAKRLLKDGIYDTAAGRPILRGGGPADYFENHANPARLANPARPARTTRAAATSARSDNSSRAGRAHKARHRVKGKAAIKARLRRSPSARPARSTPRSNACSSCTRSSSARASCR
jgi:hypothetical protein